MIFESNSVPDLLHRELERRIRVNPRYSQRSFSRALKMSPGELSEILRGVRPVTYKTAMKIAKNLSFTTTEMDHLVSLVRKEREKDVIAPNPAMPLKSSLQLSDEIFNVVSEWFHFAILNLMNCRNFVWNHTYIAKRLAITPTQAMSAMRQLLKLGLVKEEGSKILPSEEQVVTSDQIPSLAIQQYHQQILDKAKEALVLQNIKQRDFSGVGFALRIRDLPALKKDIAKFQDEILAKYASQCGEDVYQLEVALFKLTSEDGK